MRSAIWTIALLGIACAISVALAEVAVRIAAPQPPSWLGIYTKHPVLPYALQPEASYRVDTGATRWTVHSDARGLRVAEKPVPAAADAPLLLVLGDSFAFGHGVEFEESFAGMLAADGTLRVANTALPGWGPVQYRRMLDFQLSEGNVPNRILLSIYVGNDFHDCVWDRDVPVRHGILGDPGGIRSFVKRNSHLYRLLSKAYHAVAEHEPGDRYGTVEQLVRPAAWTEPPLSEALPLFRGAVVEIAATAAARGIDLRAIVIPASDTVDAVARGRAPTADWDPSLPNRKTAEVLEGAGIPFVDVTDALAKLGARDGYLPFDGHLTPRANRIVADAVQELFARPAAQQAAGAR